MAKIFYLILIVSCLCGYSINSQGKFTNNSKYRTWISTIKDGGMLKVAANFENKTGDELNISYIMISNRWGHDGNSLTTQKGTVKIGSFKLSVLSTSNINLAKNDVYNLVLTTFKNDEVIGKDSVLCKQN